MSKKRLQGIFGQQGLLAKRLKSFRVRSQQLDMANAVYDTIISQEWLIAEAATGTGKTFAYLVPSLLSGKKILITTATKTLQDQLVLDDIPKILMVLGLSLTVQNLKGRDNYLCKYHIQRILSEQHAYQLPHYSELLNIYEQMPGLSLGEKSEIINIPQDSPLWHGITAHAEVCLASKCPMQSECFLYQARQKAMAADCVVVNHHLFFADSRLKVDGFGALLPAFEIIVFDEAHQLVDIATQFYSQSFSTAHLLKLAQELQTTPALPSQKLLEQSALLESNLHLFLRNFDSWVSPQLLLPLFKQKKIPIQEWQSLLIELQSHLDGVSLEDVGWKTRITQILDLMHKLDSPHSEGIAWLQPLKKHLRFQWSPLCVAAEVKELLQGLKASLIFTSATLQTGGHFKWFQEALGLEQALTKAWTSPYNWSEQALLYIPHHLPDVYHEHYYTRFIAQILPVIEGLGGKTFILFTSHRALQWVAEELKGRCPFPLFVQGTEDKARLLASFRQQGNGVLLGTGSFWEGVDVQGEALSCVAIDKLPFLNIAEPLVAAKMRQLKSQGKSVFDEYLIPKAILTLKQGVGRLLRTEHDRGVLIIGDPRLIGRPYGHVFKQSLPEMTWTRSLEKVMHFIGSFQTLPQVLEE